MASISTDPNGLRLIQFVAGDGKRKSIRLGRVTQKQADKVLTKVEALNAAAITGDAIGRSRLISARPDVGVGRGLPSTTAGGGVPEGTPVMVVGMNVATFEYELQREEASELRSTA